MPCPGPQVTLLTRISTLLSPIEMQSSPVPMTVFWMVALVISPKWMPSVFGLSKAQLMLRWSAMKSWDSTSFTLKPLLLTMLMFSALEALHWVIQRDCKDGKRENNAWLAAGYWRIKNVKFWTSAYIWKSLAARGFSLPGLAALSVKRASTEDLDTGLKDIDPHATGEGSTIRLCL